MPDFNFMSQTIISVPKEQKEFGEKMSPLLARICYDQRFLELVDKNNYFTNCLGQQGIKQKMKEELELIEKYKDSMVFK
jgi:hypothetical protein